MRPGRRCGGAAGRGRPGAPAGGRAPAGPSSWAPSYAVWPGGPCSRPGERASDGDAAGPQDRVADEGDDVEERVAHHQGHDPAGAHEDQPQDEPHDDVAREAAEALVEVVAPADERREPDDEWPGPPGLAPPREEVADHDDLFQEGVLDGGEDEHGRRPPDRLEVGG